MRRTVSMLAVLAAGALSACGGHGASGTESVSSVATGAGGSKAGGALDKAQARALVSALNLTAADVPGFGVSRVKRQQPTPSRLLERELLRCVGGLGTHARAEGSSSNFEHSGGIVTLGISSNVSVAPSTAEAAKELALIRGSRASACVAHYLRLLFRSESPLGTTVGRVSVAQGTPPASGANGSFAWRMTASFNVHGVKIPIYLDVLGFTYGPVEVALLSSGVPRPVPASIQEQLFSLLLGRAQAHAPKP